MSLIEILPETSWWCIAPGCMGKGGRFDLQWEILLP